jgi:hypothetical protein
MSEQKKATAFAVATAILLLTVPALDNALLLLGAAGAVLAVGVWLLPGMRRRGMLAASLAATAAAAGMAVMRAVR